MMPLDTFEDFLAEKNLKTTPQRLLILDTVLEQKEHLSPEEIYEQVKQRDSSVGQATVYRTLKLLTEAGIVEPLDFADGVTRYEVAFGNKHHDHLICEVCGKNIEIFDATIEERQEMIARKHGFTLSRHKMYLFGICPDCRKNSE